MDKLKIVTYIAFVLLTTLAACNSGEYRQDAVGPIAEIVIVIDSSRWEGPPGEALREELGYGVATLPAPEPLFNLRPVEIRSTNQFTRLRQRKNVIFATPIGDSTTVGRFMRARLSDVVRERVDGGLSIYVEKPDLWRDEQVIVYLTAPTASSLAQQIRQAAGEMREIFSTAARRQMTEEMFDRGRQEDIEQQLLEEHGFAVNVQHDYFIAVDTMNTIWLRRVVSSGSWRSLLIYYEENANPRTLSPAWMQSTLDSLTGKYMEGARAGFLKTDYRRPLTFEQINFLGRYAYEMRGLWSMVAPAPDGGFQQLGMGGPFVMYAFYDRPGDRIYLIHGAVFAPGYDKRSFLRQMEVIAYTFRRATERQENAE